jgi:threonine/homoserine/homoserine lactone efflux protein
VSGQLVWALRQAWLGNAARVAPLFMAIRIAGAAYLVLLGVRRSAAIVAPCRCRRAPPPGARQGVLSNLGNPKMWSSSEPAAPVRLVVRTMLALGSCSRRSPSYG